MAGKRRRSRPAPQSSQIAKRVGLLVKELFNGSNRKMAISLGCSHSAINAVVAGDQAPGFRFLEALASHERVNADWLLLGRGVPFVDEAPSSWHLPISAQILGGPRRSHRNKLGPDTYPVPREWYYDSRYWLAVQERGDAQQDTRGWLLRHDLLLVETERDRFPDFGPNESHLCCVVLPDESPRLQLGHVELHESWDEDGQREACLEFRPVVWGTAVVEEVGVEMRPSGRLVAFFRRRPLPHAGQRQQERADTWDPEVPIRADQVVGVCLCLVRRDLGRTGP